MSELSESLQLERITVGLAQIAPVWLNREGTLKKVINNVREASQKGCQLVVFGEALVPGYPFWPELTDGAHFNSPVQKEIYSHYMQQAVQIEADHLAELCKVVRENNISVYLGIIERPLARGGHSLYRSLIFINHQGQIKSVHRKLMPTYEEKLNWAQGDGNGLRTHQLGAFTLGGLNCWENWLPLARAALYAQGEDVHVAVWPGNRRNTIDITRFIALESRSYVISVSGLMRKHDIPEQVPHVKKIIKNCPEILANGGSCVASPQGEWLIEPHTDSEALLIAELVHSKVREERQNLDPSGHYARPDVLQLTVNQERQTIGLFED